MNNKIVYGLSKLYYSIITMVGGVPTYGTPVPIPGAVNMTAQPRGDVQEFDADNIVYFRSDPNDGYDISLEVADLPQSFIKDVLDEMLDANGVMFETSDAKRKRIALLGQFEGDAKAKRWVFYNCQVNRYNFDGATSRTKTPKTKTISLVADPRDDGYVKASTTEDVNAAAYASWFSSVMANPASGMVNSITPASEDFSKVTPLNVEVAVMGGTPIGVSNGGVALGITEWSYAASTLTITKEYLAALENGEHIFTVSFATGNAVTLTVTVEA